MKLCLFVLPLTSFVTLCTHAYTNTTVYAVCKYIKKVIMLKKKVDSMIQQGMRGQILQRVQLFSGLLSASYSYLHLSVCVCVCACVCVYAPWSERERE